MAKAPLPGIAKTRLAGALGADRAAVLAACFLRDTVDKALAAGATVFVAYTPARGRKVLERLLPSGIRWIPQSGDSLGERMENALAMAFSARFCPVVMIGTDTPQIAPERLKEALGQLSEDCANLVLGPAEDGGYYLIGMSEVPGGLFSGVEWSSGRERDQTLANAVSRNLRVALLPVEYDVDTPADLERLRQELKSSAAARERAPATWDWLQHNF